MENLSTQAKEVLEALRSVSEGGTWQRGTEVWEAVYLDNARPTGMNRYQFAGYLSALETAGLYRSQGDDHFGEVLLRHTTAEHKA